jgi:hypothetical protein
MDSQCPYCANEIRTWRLGLSSIICHKCKKKVFRNFHPSELGESTYMNIELKSIVLALVVMTVFLFLGAGKVMAAIAAVTAVFFLLASEIRRAKRRVPLNWRRWTQNPR